MPGDTTTRREARLYLYDEIPRLGFVGTADSVQATSITDTYAFKDSGLGPKHFNGATIYRPTTTGDNVVRKAGALATSTGVLSHTGDNYSDTVETYYELVGYLHPDDLNACFQRAQRKVFFETQSVLTEVPDGDMEADSISAWTKINNDETVSKVTAAADVKSGVRALRVQNATANGGVKSQAITVHPSEPVRISAVVKVGSGTPSLVLYDESNSVALATITPTYDPLRWVHIWWEGTVGDSTKSVTVRLIGIDSSADVYWDHAVFYHMNARFLAAPSWLNEPHKFLKLRQTRYRISLEDHIDDEFSREFMDWSQPNHFSLEPLHLDANPYTVALKKPLIGDLWIEGKRPYFDIEALDGDSDITTAPFLLFIAYAKWELADLLMKRFPTDEQWATLKQDSETEIKAETLSRPEIPDVPKKVNLLGRI